MKKLLAFASLFFLSFSQTANALFELRGGYEMLNAKGIENNPTANANPKAFKGLTADALLTLDGFVLGVRYENLKASDTNGSIEFKADFKRTSAVLGYRFIDTIAYLGPIATFGLSSSLDYETNMSGFPNETAPKKSSYSLGIEGGIHTLGFLVGAEFGYLSAKFGDLQLPAGTVLTNSANGKTTPPDMSGTYARILIGISI